MDDSVITDRHVTIKYLLGTLPEAERLRVEEAFFGNDETFEAMLAAEEEMFIEYARGALAADERAAFEARFLATREGRRRLAFSTALMDALERRTPLPASRPVSRLAPPRVDRRWVQGALVAAVVVLAAATGWLARELAQFRSTAAITRAREAAVSSDDRIARADLEREKTQRAQLERDLAAARSTPAPLIVSVLLSPGLTRSSGGSGRITLASNVDVLRVQLEASRLAAGPYRATLRTAEGDVVWSGQVSRTPPTGVIPVDLPARLLLTHDYEIALDVPPHAPAASYALTVVRR